MSIERVGERITESLDTLEDERIASLARMRDLEVSKRLLLQREARRLESKLGKQHVRARDVQDRVKANLAAINGLELARRRASRYLGNSDSKELHDIRNEQRRCQIDQIRADRAIGFKSIAEAEALGYDFCAYCFGKAKSKH